MIWKLAHFHGGSPPTYSFTSSEEKLTGLVADAVVKAADNGRRPVVEAGNTLIKVVAHSIFFEPEEILVAILIPETAHQPSREVMDLTQALSGAAPAKMAEALSEMGRSRWLRQQTDPSASNRWRELALPFQKTEVHHGQIQS